MKIAIISPTYRKEASYQENIWAEELSRRGFTLGVFTAIHCHGKLTDQAEMESSIHAYGYQLIQLASKCLSHGLFLNLNLANALKQFMPDLILLFGAGSFFEKTFLEDESLASIPCLCFFSISRAGRHACLIDEVGISMQERLKAFSFQLLRLNTYARSVKRSTIAISNTPEGTDILDRLFEGEYQRAWQQKKRTYSLAFCQETFYFDLQVRAEQRKSLGVGEDDLVLMYSSRFEENKIIAIQDFLSKVKLLSGQIKNLRAYLIGFKENAISLFFRNLIEKDQVLKAMVICLPFQNRKSLSALYQSSDLAFFPQPSISIQEAMGTGLWVICYQDPSLTHLKSFSQRMTICQNKEIHTDPQLLFDLHSPMLTSMTHRQKSAEMALAFSAKSLCDRVLGELSEIRNKRD
jgi:hypothetical protein